MEQAIEVEEATAALRRRLRQEQEDEMSRAAVIAYVFAGFLCAGLGLAFWEWGTLIARGLYSSW